MPSALLAFWLTWFLPQDMPEPEYVPGAVVCDAWVCEGSYHACECVHFYLQFEETTP